MLVRGTSNPAFHKTHHLVPSIFSFNDSTSLNHPDLLWETVINGGTKCNYSERPIPVPGFRPRRKTGGRDSSPGILAPTSWQRERCVVVFGCWVCDWSSRVGCVLPWIQKSQSNVLWTESKIQTRLSILIWCLPRILRPPRALLFKCLRHSSHRDNGHRKQTPPTLSLQTLINVHRD